MTSDSRGLPLTTGEGNTAQERLAAAAEKTRQSYVPGTPEKYPGTRISGALLTDVEALLAECGRLREQLDAARQALEVYADEGPAG